MNLFQSNISSRLSPLLFLITTHITCSEIHNFSNENQEIHKAFRCHLLNKINKR